MTPSIVERALEHFSNDFDPKTRLELEALIARARADDREAIRELEDRFSGELEFGTAGLRGVVAAGQSRMNRAVVVRATCGLVREVSRSVEAATTRGVVIGRDGRSDSAEFQRDAAETCAAAGMRVHAFSEPVPTPVVAFAVREVEAAAGVVITASHNPPAYNGYKVYWENGAQIIPPIDRQIAEAIAAAPRAREIPRMPIDEATALGRVVSADGIEGRYIEALDGLKFADDAPVGDLRIAYSALHGVGERFVRTAFSRRGYRCLESVPEQSAPDGRFPTVDFPNPEEPRALDRVLALARKTRADVVLVNDPDADRLGVAAWSPNERDFRVLDGNEIGALIASHAILHCGGPDALVTTTIVSSRLLRRMAKDLGVRYAETLTGFKWIANESLRMARAEGLRFLFGYEEALGFSVGGIVLDKDGIGAALVVAELAAVLRARGETLVSELERIRRTHGFFIGRQKSITLPGREGSERILRAMERLRTNVPRTLGGVPVASFADLDAGVRREADGRKMQLEIGRADVVVFDLLDGSRVAVRPSGTEPKIKLYFEVVEALATTDSTDDARARAMRRIDAIEADMLEAAALPHTR